MAYKKHSDVHVVSLSAYTRPEIIEDKRKEWVAYGSDNNHFGYLIDRYVGSTTNQAIVDGAVRLIYGKGLSATQKQAVIEDWAKFQSMLSKEDLRKVVFDRYLLGLGAILVSKTGNKVKMTHWPMDTLRAGKSEEGEIKKWYYHPRWTERKSDRATDDLKVFPAYESGSKAKEQILITKPYVTGYFYYPPVHYEGSLPYALLEEEIADYLINDIQNGFSGTKVINFNNGVPSPEEQREIVRRTEQKLTGSKGLKTIIAFNRDETKKTTVEDIPLNDAPAHYQYLAEEAERKLLKGHKAPSVLLGFNADSSGFSNNAEELRNKMIAFDNYVIKPFQNEIIEAIEKVLNDNGISLNLYFKTLEPLEFTETGVLPAPTEETGIELSSDLPDLLEFVEKGEEITEDWELIDEREVDYELDDDFDNQVKEWEQSLDKEPSLLKKIWNLVSTGTARPNTKSEQDEDLGENYYRVRYKYSESPASTAVKQGPTRPFCAAMERVNKLYRKEDIIALENKRVNPGFGPGGSDTYSIWLYKGGPNCGHRWVRQTFKNKSRFQSIDFDNDKISNAQAEREGYRVRNEPEVSQPPRFMPNNGYLNPR
jgi:hypothetical protein